MRDRRTCRRSLPGGSPLAQLYKRLNKGEAHAIRNIGILASSAADFASRLPAGSADSALAIQSLHHMHQRALVFEGLGRVERPGGRLLMVEPHHDLRRVARLARNRAGHYRAPESWSCKVKRGTQDFLTCGEIRVLCRGGGFGRPRITEYWFPSMSRFEPDPARRSRLESGLGGVPGLRRMAGVLAIESRRRGPAPP